MTDKNVRACPACDSTNVYQRRSSIQTHEREHRFRCQDCGERFDAAVERTRHETHGPLVGGDTLARKLAEADPEEVSR